MSDHVTIFIVDDDSQLSESLGALVRSIGLKTRLFRSPEEFLDEYESDMRGCVVLDIRMQGMSGTKLFEVMKSRGYSIPVIFLTAYGDVPTAVQAIREGAVDFLIKPAHPSEFTGMRCGNWGFGPSTRWRSRTPRPACAPRSPPD